MKTPFFFEYFLFIFSRRVVSARFIRSKISRKESRSSLRRIVNSISYQTDGWSCPKTDEIGNDRKSGNDFFSPCIFRFSDFFILNNDLQFFIFGFVKDLFLNLVIGALNFAVDSGKSVLNARMIDLKPDDSTTVWQMVVMVILCSIAFKFALRCAIWLSPLGKIFLNFK